MGTDIKSGVSKIVIKIKSEWHNANKIRIMRFLAFCIGFVFNIIGIICVAVWKYIFCNDDKKYKYCIRLSIFGMFAEIILCSKCFFVSSVPVYDFAFGGNDLFRSANRIMERNMRDFDREFERIERQMVRDRKILEKQIERAMKDNNAFENGDIKSSNFACDGEKCKNIKPEVKRTRSEKDGWVNETVTETTPNSYTQVSTASYDSRRDERRKDDKSIDKKVADKNVKGKTGKKIRKDKRDNNKKDSKRNNSK